MINFCAIVVLFLLNGMLLVFYTDLRERHDNLKTKVDRLKESLEEEHAGFMAEIIRNQHNN